MFSAFADHSRTIFSFPKKLGGFLPSAYTRVPPCSPVYRHVSPCAPVYLGVWADALFCFALNVQRDIKGRVATVFLLFLFTMPCDDA